MVNYCVEFLNERETERRFFATRGEAREYARDIDCDTVVRRTNLEDVFVELTGREVRESNAS